MKISTISVRPGTVLGFRCDGRPIYPIAGGAEGDDAAAQAAAAAEATAAAEKAAADTKAAADAAAAKAANGDWDGKVESLPPAVQKMIKDAREDAGKARTTAKEQAAEEARTELLAKLGLNGDGTEKVDPEKLAAQLASKDAQLLQLQRSTVASKSARTQGADVDALLDSVSFNKDLGDLDPAADDFDKKVDALVKDALEKNPKLKAAQAAGRSGGDFTGGSGEGNARPKSIGAAIAARQNA